MQKKTFEVNMNQIIVIPDKALRNSIAKTSRNEDPKIKLKNNINKLKTKNYLSTSLSVGK